jgi:DNA-binding NarL/FixJ family response regulator
MLENSLTNLFANADIDIVNDLEQFKKKTQLIKKTYDFLFLDIQLKEENGIFLLENCPELFKSIKNIVIVSGLCSPPLVQTAFKFNARGYISKNCSIQELKEGIEQILKGEQFICKSTKEIISKDFLSQSNSFPKLTSREKEVLRHLCNSISTKEIASLMDLSTNTVQMFIKSLFLKFNINRTTDLVLYATKHGLNL